MQCKAEFQAGFRQYLKQLPEENLMGKEGRRRRQRSGGKVESGNLKGKVKRKVKMEIVETLDTDISH